MKEKIYKFILENCATTSTPDILNTTTRQDFTNRIYTKKKALDIPLPDGTTIKMVSLSSSTQDFSDILLSDLRVGVESPEAGWVNVYLDELPESAIKLIVKALPYETVPEIMEEVFELIPLLDSTYVELPEAILLRATLRNICRRLPR